MGVAFFIMLLFLAIPFLLGGIIWGLVKNRKGTKEEGNDESVLENRDYFRLRNDVQLQNARRLKAKRWRGGA